MHCCNIFCVVFFERFYHIMAVYGIQLINVLQVQQNRKHKGMPITLAKQPDAYSQDTRGKYTIGRAM